MIECFMRAALGMHIIISPGSISGISNVDQLLPLHVLAPAMGAHAAKEISIAASDSAAEPDADPAGWLSEPWRSSA